LNSTSTKPVSRSNNPIDLVQHTIEAISDAKSGNWPGAVFDSIEVARDVMDCAKEIGEAFVDSRTDAVKGDYSGNSDVGFQ